jgi:hypothetical protein
MVSERLFPSEHPLSAVPTISEHLAALEHSKGPFRSKRSEPSKEHAEADKARMASEIVLIGPFGSAIAIGSPDFGDPSNPNGLLNFRYPADDGEEGLPLFAIEPIVPDLPMRVTIMTVVPFSKLHLSSEEPSADARLSLRNEVSNRSSKALDQHEKLRRQMFRDELAHRVSRNQKQAGLQIPSGEFAVMIETFEIPV